MDEGKEKEAQALNKVLGPKQLKLTKNILIGFNLKQINLRDADLEFANLTNADLTEANLSGANLRCAHLQEAKLSQTLRLIYQSTNELLRKYFQAEKEN